ncbi:putative inactive receptor kinase [Drosera capensis]
MQHFHLILRLFLLLSTTVSSAPSSPETDATALLHFKSKSDPHNTLHFPTNTSLCKWRGIECSSTRRVVRLVLENSDLAGPFPDDTVTKLDQLRVLSLRNNSFTGPIPDLSGLLNLKALFLDHNSFNGSFPPSISSLHHIRTLDLSHNNLSGPIPASIEYLDRLYSLRLDSNRFNGSIPAISISSLEIFNVSDNNLSGPIPVTATLSRFGIDGFSSNPDLCGVIVHRECKPKIPFFSSTTASAPFAQPSSSPPQIASGTDAQLHSRIDTGANPRRKFSAVVWGFSAALLVLLLTLFCIAIGVRDRRRRRSSSETKQDPIAVETGFDAEEVMRKEEEMEEKVKAAATRTPTPASVAVAAAAKSGSLVFCAGESEAYTVEQLMRASAELLGRGTMGTTYKAVLDESRLIVCVKRLDAARMSAGAGKDGFVRHMESVGGLRHPNLVPLRAYFQAKEERLIVFDYQANGSLCSLIHGSKSGRAKPLHWTSCLKIAEDVAQGLSYIHQAWRLVHGNLKATNVLLGSDFEACVTDYCIAALADPVIANDPTSSGYTAPEAHKSPHLALTSKADVYAFGVLLLELLTGKTPAQHPSSAPTEMVKWVRSIRDVDDPDEDNRLAMLSEVAIACRMASPDQRPTMWQVLKMLQEIKEAVVMEDHELDPLAGLS